MFRWNNVPEKVTENGCRNNNLQKCGLITCCVFLSWCEIPVLIPLCHILLARQRRMCIMHALCLPHTDFLIHDVWWFWSRECVKVGYFCVSVERGSDSAWRRCTVITWYHILLYTGYLWVSMRAAAGGAIDWGSVTGLFSILSAPLHWKTRYKVKCQTQSEAKDEYRRYAVMTTYKEPDLVDFPRAIKSFSITGY